MLDNDGTGELSKARWVVNLFCWSALLPTSALATERSVADHKLVRHSEQVSQHILIDTGEANQHRVIANVVVRHVVNIGVPSEQFGTIIEIDADHERIGLGGSISRDTC